MNSEHCEQESVEMLRCRPASKKSAITEPILIFTSLLHGLSCLECDAALISPKVEQVASWDRKLISLKTISQTLNTENQNLSTRCQLWVSFVYHRKFCFSTEMRFFRCLLLVLLVFLGFNCNNRLWAVWLWWLRVLCSWFALEVCRIHSYISLSVWFVFW